MEVPKQCACLCKCGHACSAIYKLTLKLLTNSPSVLNDASQLYCKHVWLLTYRSRRAWTSLFCFPFLGCLLGPLYHLALNYTHYITTHYWITTHYLCLLPSTYLQGQKLDTLHLHTPLPTTTRVLSRAMHIWQRTQALLTISTFYNFHKP